MSAETLNQKMQPLLDFLSSFDVDQKQAAETLEERFPWQGPEMQAIFQLGQQGVEEGWLCDRENGGVKFSRLAKPSPTSLNFSIDAVMMNGPGPTHTHPQGEIDLCFPLSGSPEFDNNPPGWTVYGKGSTHTPTVSEGAMLIFYFLPEGQIEFKK